MFDFLSRRSLLALLGVGSAAGSAQATEAAREAIGSEPIGKDSAAPATHVVRGRAALAALRPEPGGLRYLDEAGRSGWWRWQEGDHSPLLTNDPLQGLAIAAAGPQRKAGAWIRDWDGTHGRPEWFGARADDPAFDNQPAIQAALDICPTVQLGPGAYHVAATLTISRNGTRLQGSGTSQTDQGVNVCSTRLVCTDGAMTILRVGSTSASQPKHLIECVQLRDFSVVRTASPRVGPAERDGAIGIELRWCVNCHIERVFSIDSAKGWYLYGTIENYLVACSALRSMSGSDRAHDFFIGFHLDYTAPLAANGGNASLYIRRCRAFAGFGKGTPDLPYSAGLRTDGGWVDLYIDAFETGLIQYGIDGHGDSYSGSQSYKTEDLIITNCVLDPGHLACIRLQTADTTSAVQISNCYLAVGPEGTCVALKDLGGSISLTANQCITASEGGSGVTAANVNNLRTTNNIYTKIREPIVLQNVMSFHLQDSVHALSAVGRIGAVKLTACNRGKVDCIVNGPSGPTTAGVVFDGPDNNLIEVNCTNLQSTAFAAGAAGKLIHNGTPVTVAGPFGRDCLAQGIML